MSLSELVALILMLATLFASMLALSALEIARRRSHETATHNGDDHGQHRPD